MCPNTGHRVCRTVLSTPNILPEQSRAVSSSKVTRQSNRRIWRRTERFLRWHGSGSMLAANGNGTWPPKIQPNPPFFFRVTFFSSVLLSSMVWTRMWNSKAFLVIGVMRCLQPNNHDRSDHSDNSTVMLRLLHSHHFSIFLSLPGRVLTPEGSSRIQPSNHYMCCAHPSHTRALGRANFKTIVPVIASSLCALKSHRFVPEGRCSCYP